MKIVYCCYGNGRSAILEEATRLKAQESGLELEVSSGGIPKYTAEGKYFDQSILQATKNVYPTLAKNLSKKQKRILTKSDIESGILLPVDEYLKTELINAKLVEKNKVETIETLLNFAGIPGVKGDMDDADQSIQERIARYVENRLISKNEQFEYKSINGVSYQSRTPEAYEAMVKNCMDIASAVVEKCKEKLKK